jgi:hypothetical protein
MERSDAAGRILADVPDLGDWNDLEIWFAKRREALAALRSTPEITDTLFPVDVGAQVGAPRSPFGRYADPVFRKLVLATFLADWACYDEPVNQVSLARLFYVMDVFPSGFRAWWVESPEAGWLPVGYTGWCPISTATFEAFAGNATTLRDRSVVVLPALDPAGSFLYLFNYSIAPPLRRSACSRRLMCGLAGDIEAVHTRGLAAITVSEDGARAAERFGMSRTGTVVIDGFEEAIYTVRRDGRAGADA